MEITFEELQARIPTLASFDAEGNEIKPYTIFLNQAKKWLSKNITGKSLFDEIEASEDTEAKEFCKTIVCYKGYLESIPFLDLVQTGSGFAVASNTNIAPASKDRVNALKNGILSMLTTSVDDLIAFLEETTAYHVNWKKSATYSLLTDTLISTIIEFNKYANFTGNRLDFIKAHPIMLDAIKLHLAQYISQEQCDLLIDQLREGNVSESNAPIIEEVKLAYANFVIGEKEKAVNYANRVRSYMIENLQEFPAFADSSNYASYVARIANQSTDGSILSTVG